MHKYKTASDDLPAQHPAWHRRFPGWSLFPHTEIRSQNWATVCFFLPSCITLVPRHPCLVINSTARGPTTSSCIKLSSTIACVNPGHFYKKAGHGFKEAAAAAEAEERVTNLTQVLKGRGLCKNLAEEKSCAVTVALLASNVTASQIFRMVA